MCVFFGFRTKICLQWSRATVAMVKPIIPTMILKCPRFLYHQTRASFKNRPHHLHHSLKKRTVHQIHHQQQQQQPQHPTQRHLLQVLQIRVVLQRRRRRPLAVLNRLQPHQSRPTPNSHRYYHLLFIRHRRV